MIRAHSPPWVPRVTLEHWHSKANENNLLPAERSNVTRGTQGNDVQVGFQPGDNVKSGTSRFNVSGAPGFARRRRLWPVGSVNDIHRFGIQALGLVSGGLSWLFGV